MQWIKEIRFFQKAAVGIFSAFMGLMILVTIVAYSRQSGFTHQDMAEAPFIRAKATEELLAEKLKASP